MSSQKHDKTWTEFVHWCSKRKLRVLPAHPWTIAAYLRWIDSKDDGDRAESIIKSISRAHILRAQRSPHDHPVITRTLLSIARRRKSAPDRSNLFDDKDFLSKRPIEEDEPALNDDDQEDVPETEVQTLRRGFAMRSTPKLVRRKKPVPNDTL
ncbi:MAG: hypothetical protein HON65_12425 [Rhodospirillales bacterium]|jgi:hypothetical protein|nr:hypothetical protein [Rhodospirillales bacterium]